MEKICTKYPLYMTTSPIGEKLYKLWRDIRAQRLIPCVRTWAIYEEFFEWSMANGVTETNFLVRKNLDKAAYYDNYRKMLGLRFMNPDAADNRPKDWGYYYSPSAATAPHYAGSLEVARCDHRLPGLEARKDG